MKGRYNGRIYGLDAMRGIAAATVAWHHLQQSYGLDVSPIAAVSAVDLFLVISGFVMARTYEHRMPSRGSFLALRYRRLWPTMAFGTFVGGGVILHNAGVSPALALSFTATLFFLPIGLPLFAVNLPAWSLFAEIVANYLHAGFLGRSQKHRLITIAIVLGLIFSVASFCIGRVAWGSDYPSLAVATARCLFCYVVGILIFRSYAERTLGSAPMASIAAVPVILVAGGMLPDVLFSVLFAVTGAPFLVRLSMGLQPSRLALYAGAMSFPLYAVHLPIIQLCQAMKLGPTFAATVALAIAVGITIVTEMKPIRPLRRNPARGNS